MASRNFNRKQTLEHEIKDIYLKTKYTALVQASGALNLTNDITLTKVAGGATNNGYAFTMEIAAAAGNPTDTVLAAFTGAADDIVLTITPNDGTNNPNIPATATMVLSANAYLTKVAGGSTHNGDTLTLNVQPAAANPTDTILAVYTGTSNNTILTITPNDGTNNGATPVDMTTAELVEFITTQAVVGKNVTITDVGNLKALLTATGGDATPLADSGEGDGVVATFAGGANTAVSLTTAEVVELINTGAVAGKTVTVTDAASRRNDQTASGGGATVVVHSGEGDGVNTVFAGGVDQAFTNLSRWGVSSITETSTGLYKITLEDKFASLKMLSVIVQATVAKDLHPQIKAADVNGNKTIDFFLLAGITPTNPATDSIIEIAIELKNTTIL